MEGEKSKLKMPDDKGINRPPESPSSAPPWIELPDDVTANVLRRLSAIQILLSAQKVCTTWRRVCKDPAIWRVVEFDNSNRLDIQYDLNTVCRLAVDRSQGQVTDIRLARFGDDGLVRYIAQRASNLRSLTLEHCYNISGNCLSEMARKFPQLEELHLIMMPCILPKDIEAIGISCPMLESFTLVELGCRHTHMIGSDEFMYDLIDRNAYAMAVAKGMPNLRHLLLFANDMENQGLEAILDNCPHLESLDIRQCFGVDLRGGFGKRCSRQIKHVRSPYDSCSDCNWDCCASCRGENNSPDYCDLDAYGYYDEYNNPFCMDYMAYCSDDEEWFYDPDY